MDPQQQEIQPSALQEKPQKNWWKIIAVVLIAVIIVSGLVFAGYTLGQKNSVPLQETATNTVLSPTQTVSQTQSISPTGISEPTITLEKLRFTIPTGWWSEQDEQSTTEKWFNINPTALPRPGDTPPAFTVNFEKNKTIEQKKNELIKNWGLSNIKEVAIQSNSISGIILEGTTEPGFLDARRIKIAVTSSGENVYYLFDLALTDNHEKYFNDILSTFNFIQ